MSVINIIQGSKFEIDGTDDMNFLKSHCTGFSDRDLEFYKNLKRKDKKIFLAILDDYFMTFNKPISINIIMENFKEDEKYFYLYAEGAGDINSFDKAMENLGKACFATKYKPMLTKENLKKLKIYLNELLKDAKLRPTIDSRRTISPYANYEYCTDMDILLSVYECNRKEKKIDVREIAAFADLNKWKKVKNIRKFEDYINFKAWGIYYANLWTVSLIEYRNFFFRQVCW